MKDQSTGSPKRRADLAPDLMWRFMDLAEPVINRFDDSNGAVGDVFRFACEDLGTIAIKAKPDAAGLVDRVVAAVDGERLWRLR